jgi:hypothetical protein
MGLLIPVTDCNSIDLSIAIRSQIIVLFPAGMEKFA